MIVRKLFCPKYFLNVSQCEWKITLKSAEDEQHFSAICDAFPRNNYLIVGHKVE